MRAMTVAIIWRWDRSPPFVSENRERGILANLFVRDFNHALLIRVPDFFCGLHLPFENRDRFVRAELFETVRFRERGGDPCVDGKAWGCERSARCGLAMAAP